MSDADALIAQLVGDIPEGYDRRLAVQLLRTAVDLIGRRPPTLDLKIAATALREMSDAFAMFAATGSTPKATIFGSARVQPQDRLYDVARTVARGLADAGWMVITGAGPGIMQAGMEGAGRDRSIGVSIRLPFEQGANPVIAGDPKYVSMRYFFTRKLMLVKDSRGFVALPGGYGTLDETFELLTLTQTGKGIPVPIVLLDAPGDPYWETVDAFVREQLIERGLVAKTDRQLYLITERPEDAVAEIVGFYRNYDSMRYVGAILVIRVRTAPTAAQLGELAERFGHLCARGGFAAVPPSAPEQRDNDRLDLHRIAFEFGRHSYGDLRELIDVVNGFADG